MRATLSADPRAAAPELAELARQAAELFRQAAGTHPGFRLAHAKGLVCVGSFKPSAEARSLSRAAHFEGAPIPVLARFSNGTGLPEIPDGDANANPRGLGLRFQLADGRFTDIVANGLEGFPASTPAEFVAFFRAALASPPDAPKPTALQQFLAAHPETAAFLGQPNPTPASFAQQAYFGNNAFIFMNTAGQTQAIRYQIMPKAGPAQLSADVAAQQPPNFLMDELKTRLGQAPVEFELWAQLAETGDSTDNVMRLWPASRRKVLLGTIQLTHVDLHSDQTQRALALDPTNLIDGIEPSADPLLPFRRQVYVLSVQQRR